ncbi:MAG: cytidine deaminase [Bacteroidetes bacterium QS_7_67_15]|nr:MAG: cytidine deaminase [Bacteroidetes bacterium QS_7_67_15]
MEATRAPFFPGRPLRPLASAPRSALRARAQAASERAHVPFSGRAAAAALLFDDGVWAPGVRVESASFSLTIPPALNAYTTAVASGRRAIVAAAFSRPVRRVERAFLDDLPGGPFRRPGEHVCVADGAAPLPSPRRRLTPFLDDGPVETPRAGTARARSLARNRALVPASRFPVGGVLAVAGRLVPGVNVEPHADPARAEWTHVLCAERNALGTACSYGLLGAGAADDPEASSEAPSGNDAPTAPALYLSCPEAPSGGSPCGACRQLLVELLPRGVLWMDRAPPGGAPERARPADLLPGSFQGTSLPRGAPSA